MKRFVVFLVIIGSLYYSWSSCLSFYYRAKYYSGVLPLGERAVAARTISHTNHFFDQNYAVLIDMSLPSSDNNRLKVYDLQRMRKVFTTRVMHGAGSGKRRALHFSNRLGSNETALGRYVIVEKYQGKFGKAYRLAGLDNSNYNALSRSIVLHSSDFVSNNSISRSKGCPAVSHAALNAMRPYFAGRNAGVAVSVNYLVTELNEQLVVPKHKNTLN